jgi:hypothetical protein
VPGEFQIDQIGSGLGLLALGMRDWIILIVPLITTVVRLVRPAEYVQSSQSPFLPNINCWLSIVRASRTPNLRIMDRLIAGFCSLWIVDGLALCRMLKQAIRGASLPKYLRSDHDPSYRCHQWGAKLRILGVTEIKTVPSIPWWIRSMNP